MIYCGIDWAEKTHDVALVDDSGQLVAKRHITDDAAGYKILLDLLAEYGDTRGGPDPGRDRDIPGPAGLGAADRQTTGVRDQPDGRGPLPRPAFRLAQEVRPGRRPGPGQRAADRHARSPAASAGQRSGPRRRRPRPRSAGRDLEPPADRQPAPLAAARVLPGRSHGRRILEERALPTRGPPAPQAGPDAGQGRSPHAHTVTDRAQAGRSSARHRRRHRTVPRGLPSRMGPPAAAGRGRTRLEAACTAADSLAEAVEEAFPQHPDAEIILSFPGLGTQLGARVLAEIGDDRQRFADAAA